MQKDSMTIQSQLKPEALARIYIDKHLRDTGVGLY